MENKMHTENIIQFIKQKDYRYIKEIGQGATGRLVLINDPTVNVDFACKKYSPVNGVDPKEFYTNFVSEIKLLHLLYHPNIVRIFNYYLYPVNYTGYIVMEYIKGDSINTYIENNPHTINIVFEQAMNAFSYIHKQKILHRDIRPQNIIITDNSTLKVIDFGFGKKIDFTINNNNSLTSILNWFVSPPDEFSEKRYDFATEIYFVGGLFQDILNNNKNIQNFKYMDILSLMTKKNPLDRIKSFEEIERKMIDLSNNSFELFCHDEKVTYRDFASALSGMISAIYEGASYQTDIQEILKGLEFCYQNNMLESQIQYTPNVVRCFLNGSYKYSKKNLIYVSTLKSFIDLLKYLPKNKQMIVLNNLWQRLNVIERIKNDDDLPF